MRSTLDAQLKIFIRENIKNNPAEIALKYAGNKDFPVKLVVDQIKARQKAVKKLPSWYHNDELVFPPTISIEQCSSELASEFKTRFYKGAHVLDITGGSGVDTAGFGRVFNQVTYVEPDSHLCELARNNMNVLGLNHIDVVQNTAEAFLELDNQQYDLIYIDPSRRDNAQNKVYALDDCYPNVIELLPELLKRSDQVLIKASPMIDIKKALKDILHVTRVQALAIDNEMKELLFHVQKGNEDEPVIEAWNISSEKENQTFSFTYAGEKNTIAQYSSPKQYVYDMNVAMMKAGAFKSVLASFEVHKLHAHTHLYTSDLLINEFPGRVFEVQEVIKPSKKNVLDALNNKKANITTRNYPMGPVEIKKKFGLKDGGEKYLFFCDVVESGMTCIVCEKAIDWPV